MMIPAPTVDPQSPWSPHAVRIRNILHEVPNVATYELGFEDDALRRQFRFSPGQFNMLYLPGIGEIAISISSDPDAPERLLHTIRVVGNVTRAISKLTVGDQLLVRGPFGSAWPMDVCRGKDVLIATGGLGLAPLRPAIYHIRNHRDDFRKVTILYGARTSADLLYTAEYDAWREAGIDVEVTVDLGDADWQGQIGVVPALIGQLQLDAGNTTVLTCGPEVMMRFVAMDVLPRGVPSGNIYLSMERNMNCALGFCGQCQLGPEFICKNGPVFEYPRLEPYLGVEDF